MQKVHRLGVVRHPQGKKGKIGGGGEIGRNKLGRGRENSRVGIFLKNGGIISKRERERKEEENRGERMDKIFCSENVNYRNI